MKNAIPGLALLLASLSACQTPSATQPAERAEPAMANAIVVTGSAFYRERMLAPPGATLRVSVIDAAIADKAALEVMKAVYPVGGKGGPFDFTMVLRDNQFEAAGRYMVRAVIIGNDDELLWTSDTAHLVDPSRKSQTIGPITLVRVAATRADLEGQWRVSAISGLPVSASAAPWLTFAAGGAVSGFTGCNSLSGSYRVSGARISFGPLATTRRACLDEPGKTESHFLEAMANVTSFDATADDQRRLFGPGNTLIMLERKAEN